MLSIGSWLVSPKKRVGGRPAAASLRTSLRAPAPPRRGRPPLRSLASLARYAGCYAVVFLHPPLFLWAVAISAPRARVSLSLSRAGGCSVPPL